MPEDNHSHEPHSHSAPPDDGPTRVIKEPRGGSNPLYGCAILVIAISTFGFIVTWTIYSGLKQNAEIGTFTSQDAPSLPQLDVPSAAVTEVRYKLEAFAAQAIGGAPTSLTLTAQELNATLLLAAEEGVADYRDMVRFTGFDAASRGIKADIRWKMNNLPFVQGPDRYLAGHATFKPVIENGALEMHIESLEVPGKSVSEGFIRQLRNWPWLNLAKLQESVKGPLSKVSGFEFSPDNASFTLTCGTPAGP